MERSRPRFARFAELPKELQIKIFEFAATPDENDLSWIDHDTLVDLARRFCLDIPADKMWKLLTYWVWMDGISVVGPRIYLQRACVLSRQVAHEACKKSVQRIELDPNEPVVCAQVVAEVKETIFEGA